MNQAVKARPKPLITLISEICRKILDNRASLPTMPDVAARIHKAMTSPNWSITPIREVDLAVARIGMNNTRSLVMGHALRSMYVTRSPMLGALIRGTWETSARLAAYSGVLARHCSRMSPERALLAGLLQDIGSLPILNVLKEYEDQLNDEAQIVSAVERYSAHVGVVLLKQWDFEPELVEVAKSRGDWLRDPAPKPDLADLILLARLHDRVVRGEAEGLPSLEQLPAFDKFSIGDLDPDSSLAVLNQEQSSVTDIIRALGAAK